MPSLPNPPESRPKSYPVVGDRLRHAMARRDELWVVVAVAPHPVPRKTRQRAVTLRQADGRERVFAMSVRDFWFNWLVA